MGQVNLRQFDYVALAKYDAEMWRTYYNHQFLKMAVLLFKMGRQQFKLSPLTTLRLSFYAGWAATDYRLRKGHENNYRVLKNLTKFYKLISARTLESFDYKRAAQTELQWWNIHRYPKKYKKSLSQALAESAAVIYKVPVSSLSGYARYRAQAMLIPGHQGDDQPNPPDYEQITKLLIKAWRSLHQAAQNS